MLVFNNKDRLQEHWMKQQGIAHTCPPAHGLPSSEAFVSAALAGMGWGMNPELLVREALTELTTAVRHVAGKVLLHGW